MRDCAVLFWMLAFTTLHFIAPAASSVTLDWVTVGDAGNACDVQTQGCFGSVTYVYQISEFEITNAQYAEFLNAVAASDPVALYNTAMATDPRSGITRSGIEGAFTYTVSSGRGDWPVVLVSFWDAVRFVNWINNGQGSASTETGSYTLLSGTASPSNPEVSRNAGAIVVVPSEDEWYKAAYYSASEANYFDYPASSDVQTTCALPGSASNTANCGQVSGMPSIPEHVGSYPGSGSPVGTFDQGGNVSEWNEDNFGGNRGVRGGNHFNSVTQLAASSGLTDPPQLETAAKGFRVVRLAPASPIPALDVFGLVTLAGLLCVPDIAALGRKLFRLRV